MKQRQWLFSGWTWLFAGTRPPLNNAAAISVRRLLTRGGHLGEVHCAICIYKDTNKLCLLHQCFKQNCKKEQINVCMCIKSKKIFSQNFPVLFLFFYWLINFRYFFFAHPHPPRPKISKKNPVNQLIKQCWPTMWKTEYLTPIDIFYLSFVYYYIEIWMGFSPGWKWSFQMVENPIFRTLSHLSAHVVNRLSRENRSPFQNF